VCRKSFLPEAKFQTGNGITLCRDCHREVHGGFNGRRDLQQPMDAQGGEKIDMMERLYGALCEDARERGIMRDDLYFVGDTVLARFKMFQGFDPWTPFPGCRIEQAHLIWRQCPQHTLKAVPCRERVRGFSRTDASGRGIHSIRRRSRGIILRPRSPSGFATCNHAAKEDLSERSENGISRRDRIASAFNLPYKRRSQLFTEPIGGARMQQSPVASSKTFDRREVRFVYVHAETRDAFVSIRLNRNIGPAGRIAQRSIDLIEV